MFQFSPFASLAYFIQQEMLALHASGFPHSDIPGSLYVGNSPRLFAACYVLLRFLAPKHPPYTLIILNLFSFSLYLIVKDLIHLSSLPFRVDWADILMRLQDSNLFAF